MNRKKPMTQYKPDNLEYLMSPILYLKPVVEGLKSFIFRH